MQIHLAGILFDPQEFEHQCEAEEYLSGQEYSAGTIDIKVMVAREGNSMKLDLSTDLDSQFTCDRCGDPFTKKVACQAEYYFTFSDDKSADIDHENAIIPANAIYLDISQEIRDTIILGLPGKILCRQDCLGLCAKCGTNLNEKQCKCEAEEIYPRWEKLKNLKKNK